jgi:hypothetical protein
MLVHAKYFVYWNLHKKCWSMKNKKTGIVDGHANTVVLHGCTLKVSATGRDRVRQEKRKNVHAGIIGEPIDIKPCDQFGDELPVESRKELLYNPYKYDGFVLAEKPSSIVREADWVEMLPNGKVYAYGRIS